jgi:hypothetical protein
MADVTEDGEYIEGEVVRPVDSDTYDGDDSVYDGDDGVYDGDAEDVELPDEVEDAIETMPHGDSHAR